MEKVVKFDHTDVMIWLSILLLIVWVIVKLLRI